MPQRLLANASKSYSGKLAKTAEVASTMSLVLEKASRHCVRHVGNIALLSETAMHRELPSSDIFLTPGQANVFVILYTASR